jgi:RecA/RadA recombinase
VDPRDAFHPTERSKRSHRSGVLGDEMTKKRTSRKKIAVDPPVSDRSEVLARLTKSVKDFKLWADVEAPMILRTRITSLNRAMKVGGLAAGMLGILHGPSQGGKTLLGSEILRAVEETGGLGIFVDAECRGVDLKWFEVICGNLGAIVYYKPRTFEEFVSRIQSFRREFRESKKSGALPQSAMLGICVDSLNRLCPRDELKILVEGKKGEHVEARKYPLRAMMIGAWLDGLIPTLERDEVVVGVLREGDNLDAMPGQRKYKVKGGRAPIYDAGWICRVTARAKVKIRKGEKVPDVVVGEKHEIEVLKNSMGPKECALAQFYSSVGSKDGSPLGLDHARETRDEAITRGLARERELKGRKGYYVGDDFVAADLPKFLSWLLEADDETGQVRHELVADRLNGEFDVR